MIPLLLIGAGALVGGLSMQRKRGGNPGPPLNGGGAVDPDEVESLARAITSEAGSKPLPVRTAIGWTIRNAAAKYKKSITAFICNPCGRQGDKQADGTRRKFASTQEATAVNRQLAAQILSQPRSKDPTRGATAFIEPALQDQMNARWKAGKSDRRFKPYAEVRATWIAQGSQPRGMVGPFEFFA